MGGLFADTRMLTHSGQVLDLQAPDQAAIVIEDIARGLSRAVRFAGQTVGAAYSVAQHSVLVSDQCSPEASLVGLLHDAAEAYLGDWIRPAKTLLGDPAKRLEGRLLSAIYQRFGLLPIGPVTIDEVKTADDRLLATEIRDLLPDTSLRAEAIGRLPMPLAEPIEPWAESFAYVQFLRRFTELRR